MCKKKTAMAAVAAAITRRKGERDLVEEIAEEAEGMVMLVKVMMVEAAVEA